MDIGGLLYELLGSPFRDELVLGGQMVGVRGVVVFFTLTNMRGDR